MRVPASDPDDSHSARNTSPEGSYEHGHQRFSPREHVGIPSDAASWQRRTALVNWRETSSWHSVYISYILLS